MAVMLVFTLLTNIAAWVLFALTDVLAGNYSVVHIIVLAEWLLLPLAASAFYRFVIKRYVNEKSGGVEKTKYLLLWFVIGTGVAGIVCRFMNTDHWENWFARTDFNRYEYFSFAIALVFGFMILSAVYEMIDFIVDGGLTARRSEKKMRSAAVNG